MHSESKMSLIPWFQRKMVFSLDNTSGFTTMSNYTFHFFFLIKCTMLYSIIFKKKCADDLGQGRVFHLSKH